MRVHVFKERGALRIDARRVRSAVEAATAGAGRVGPISVILTGDAALARLHRRFLGVSGPTDVMSFPLGDPGGPPSGEVYVSCERAAAEARRRGIAPAEEVLRYVVHGVLHLLGEKDGTPAQRARMWKRQEAVVEGLVGRGRRRRGLSAGPPRPPSAP